AAAPDPPLGELREALVAAGRRLGARGLISAGEGNLSVRLAGDRLLITPAGLRKDELASDELLVVPLEGPLPERADGLRPSSDLAIHRAVLRARPDVSAVVHAHVPASMALTLAGAAPDPAALPETAMLLPRLPVVPYGEPGSEALATAVAAALAAGPEPLAGAVLLERHGAVAVGMGPGSGAVRQAVDRLELVDVLCRTWRDAMLVRAAIDGVGRRRAARKTR
ncbi:MAG: class II aldolase/adducin family protein, partial [Chloroflexi bacterium]|nr:class II aldolase/adducin family protein [Chloroflexota bacterium]